MKEQTRLLDRYTRWESFLYHSHNNKDKIILEVFGPIPADSSMYQFARGVFMDRVKNFKSDVLAAFEVYLHCIALSFTV